MIRILDNLVLIICASITLNKVQIQSNFNQIPRALLGMRVQEHYWQSIKVQFVQILYLQCTE